MKLMTYNILNGGQDRFEKIIEVVNQESPDFLTLNEANGFEKNGNKRLKEFSKRTGLAYYKLSLSGESDYHVAVFSKYPLKEVQEIKPLMRAGIHAVITTDKDDISILSTHLTPYTEDLRLPEIQLIASQQQRYGKKILMGDMNSLTASDAYDPNIVSSFNEMQLKKFTTHGKLRFDAARTIGSLGYMDTAPKFNKQKDYTAPTSINEYEAHSNMRLDYIFVSPPLLGKIRSYKVVRNALTEVASDHYPVVIELEQYA